MTVSLSPGELVPIPTLPTESIRILSATVPETPVSKVIAIGTVATGRSCFITFILAFTPISVESVDLKLSCPITSFAIVVVSNLSNVNIGLVESAICNLVSGLAVPIPTLPVVVCTNELGNEDGPIFKEPFAPFHILWLVALELVRVIPLPLPSPFCCTSNVPELLTPVPPFTINVPVKVSVVFNK